MDERQSIDCQKEKRIKFSEVVEVKREERRRKHRTHPRRRRSGGRFPESSRSSASSARDSSRSFNHYDPVALAPTNTTQFIINDHNSPLPRGLNGSPISACPTPSSDGGSRSRDGHENSEYDQTTGEYYTHSSRRMNDLAMEQFAQEYSQFQYDRLSEMSREELINKCIELEEALDCYDRVNYSNDVSSSSMTASSSSRADDFAVHTTSENDDDVTFVNSLRPISKHCASCTCGSDGAYTYDSSNDSSQMSPDYEYDVKRTTGGGHEDSSDCHDVVDTTTHDPDDFSSPSKSGNSFITLEETAAELEISPKNINSAKCSQRDRDPSDDASDDDGGGGGKGNVDKNCSI